MAKQMALKLRAERARLSDQCAMILGRLHYGRVSNKELSGIALKYTSRLSDLRKSGHDVRLVFRDYATGLAYYALFVDGLEWNRRDDSRTDVEMAVDELTFVGAHRR